MIAVTKRILPFMQSAKFLDSQYFGGVVYGYKQGVNEAHYHDPILEASQEHLGDQVMERMASPWKRSGLSPERGKQNVQQRTLVVVWESGSSGHPTRHICSSPSV